MSHSVTPLLGFEHMTQLGSASGYLDEIYEVVKALSLFEGFSVSEYSKFCEYMSCYGALRGDTILNEGTEGSFLVIVLTGQVDVMKNDGTGRRKLVTRVGPGGFLGEMSLIDGRQRFASCVATQPTDFAVLTRDKLNTIMLEYPRLANKVLLLVLQLMTSRLRDTTTRMLPTIVSEAI
ncbi:MAG: cyclic nucleotide-binding domain-containing protein [Rhodoferax sp.]|uniref:cyclic nucleotide-binding domain-containing protein n=1 Tax=Rhodoferax sp. TaxID=50421 RepID=UPI002622582C|nr:cyclic nucleotide-binding domain-containing protein [Rhodoferax sp.]MDD2882578.1 cyclic nucleotide-binding domain-containing protein [Rhodoferax sp.]